MECFSEPIDCSTLQSTKPKQSEESFFTEPILPALCSKNIVQRFALMAGSTAAERHIKVRLAQVSVPFRNLVFENELVAEGIPGQVRHYSVVLVPVVASVSEDDVWMELASNALERILDCIKMGREIAIPKFMEVDRPFRRGAKEFPSPTFCLARAGAGCAPDHPSEFWSRSSSRQLRQRTPAPDLDVIRVRANAKNPERCSGSPQVQP
jgi:hypothetical protein